jgi:hypothetical protein
MKQHKCVAMKLAREGLWGSAVTDIRTTIPQDFQDPAHDGTVDVWCMENGEYATYPIYYCPFCGTVLP